MSIYRKLVGWTSRSNYWSCADFADSVRAWTGCDPKPQSGTSKQWKQWRTANSRNFGYWLTEEAFDVLQDIVYFPYDVYNNIQHRIRARFVDKYWCLDTNLDKYDYHEVQERILHGLFETLVVFVEVEKAHRQYITESWEAEEEKRVKPKWKTPNREKGLEYLDWEISLGEETPEQSHCASEVKKLYLWWKDVYPVRPDPMDVSGWSAYCDEKRDDEDSLCWLDTNPEDEERVKTMLDRMREMEEQQDAEVEEMLIRLIKIRRGLWT